MDTRLIFSSPGWVIISGRRIWRFLYNEDSENQNKIWTVRILKQSRFQGCQWKKICSFQPLSQDNVRKPIKQSQCSNDSIPTWLLNEYLDSFLPLLILLVNKSLQIGYFLEEWRNVLVKHLLKNYALNLFSHASDQWVTCQISLNLLKSHQLTSWETTSTKCGLYHRANQLIDHSTAQKQHFWRYNLICY